MGTIEGGTVANAAPAYCKVECDFRYTHPEDLPLLRKKVDEVCSRQYVPDTTTKVSDSVGFATMTRLPGNLELLKIAQEVAEKAVSRNRKQDSAAAALMRLIPLPWEFLPSAP